MEGKKHMKSKILLPMMSVLLAMSMLAGTKAEAADVHVTVDADHHHMAMAPVDVTSPDTDFTTWYGNSDTTYNYDSPSSGNGRSSSNFQYSTRAPEYDGWYGIGRTGRSGSFGVARGGSSGTANANGGNGRSGR
jgi:hypothetical protein